jgi:hypothetical protein
MGEGAADAIIAPHKAGVNTFSDLAITKTVPRVMGFGAMPLPTIAGHPFWSNTVSR